MKFVSATAGAAAFLLAAHPATAQLAPGAAAPDFTVQTAKGGRQSTFHLADALHEGPVVLYFFPAAFTPGCTVEAHEFAEAMPQFQSLGARVIGVTAGNIDRLT